MNTEYIRQNKLANLTTFDPYRDGPRSSTLEALIAPLPILPHVPRTRCAALVKWTLAGQETIYLHFVA